MRRTMHILDVISSVSRSSKCTKIVGGWGVSIDPLEKLTALPRPLAGFKEPTFQAPTSKRSKGGIRKKEGRRREGKGCTKMIYARTPDTLAPLLLKPVQNYFMNA